LAGSRNKSARRPVLASDARGNIYAIWERYRNRRERPRGLGWRTSTDRGQTFTNPESVPGGTDSAGGRTELTGTADEETRSERCRRGGGRQQQAVSWEVKVVGFG